MRVTRSLGVATPVEVEVRDALRTGGAGRPPLPAGRSGADQQWIDNHNELRSKIASEDPRAFLRWPVIADAMVVPSSEPYVLDIELPAVRTSG